MFMIRVSICCLSVFFLYKNIYCIIHVLFECFRIISKTLCVFKYYLHRRRSYTEEKAKVVAPVWVDRMYSFPCRISYFAHRVTILEGDSPVVLQSRLCGWIYLIKFSIRNLSYSPCSEPSRTVLLPDVMYIMYTPATRLNTIHPPGPLHIVIPP